jgi:hypothetical protein
MTPLEDSLLKQRQQQRQKIFVLYGLGGIGKTQLAAEFARRHREKFSAIFWLDGSSVDSLERSSTRCVARIPKGQVSESSRQSADAIAIHQKLMTWLSREENARWLLIFDNVDREYQQPSVDPSAYDVKRYFPGADHGSILITTRLAKLEQLGDAQKVPKLNKLQAQAILECSYKRPVGK